MRPTAVLLPLAFGSAAAEATVYLTPQQAQVVMFPHEALSPSFRTLDDAQINAIAKASGTTPLGRQLRAWRASSGGWLLVDQVIGKHEFITYAVALDASGMLKSVEILEYRENYGDQVRNAKWRAQFSGKRAGMSLQLGKDIKNISGATLSSKHVTDGVRRLLATYALVLAHG